ncbi:MAG: TonB-dependent receptor [Methanosarcina sp.]
MRLKAFLFLFYMLFPLFVNAQAKDYTVTWNYSGQTLDQFAETAEKQLGVRFFYREEWVSGLSLKEYPGVNSLKGILDNLFRNKSLYYFIDEAGNIVLTQNYSVKMTDKNTGENGEFIPPTEYYDEEEGGKKSSGTFIELGNPADRDKPGNVTVSGYILNKDTKEPIAGVTVFVQEISAGAISNAFGYYTLSLPRGLHQLQFSFIGLKQKKINLSLYGTGEMNVDMNSVMIPLKETVVSAQKSVTMQRFEVGVERVNITSFRLLPTSMGEADIIKSMLLIPGVHSVGEGSAGFNVRGGSADQNLIMLYGAPVYNSSHFFGFFSAVNPDIIKDVTLYKGGIPGRYGGRLSSVLDIISKDGSRNEFDGNAGISPVTTHIMIEGPIKKDTCYYILSGRTTYSNWLFNLLENPSLKKSRATFYDLNGRITYELNKNNRIDFSSYFSHDSFRFNSDTTYRYDNNIYALRWRHFFSSRFFSTLLINNSNYRYDISSQDPAEEGFTLTHSLNSTGFRADFNWFSGRHELNFGVDATNYSALPGRFVPGNDSSLVIPKLISRESALEPSLYVEDKFALTNNISLNAGLRFSSYFAMGPRNVLVYDPMYSRSESTVTDTLKFMGNGSYQKYSGPELRLSLNFRITNNSSVKINYNRTRQYLHLLTNTTSISPTDTWKLSDIYLKPETADQYALGLYRMMQNGSIELSAEVYYKEMTNMVDFKGGTRLVMNANIEKDLVNVNGKSYGLELMFKRTEGKLRGSASYTYSRTLVRSTGTFGDEIINGGKWFPASFDKPNDLIIVMNYIISRRFSVSSNYTWSTGRPVTWPVTSYYLNDVLLLHYSERNKYRLPDYSRFDLSFTVNGNLRSGKIANPHWTFSVYNLLGRNNVYSVYFKKEKNVVHGYELSIFGKAFPTVTFSFDF